MLGKALFWDMQVGSDGVQACATCHFRAGADPRKKNQVSPGLLTEHPGRPTSTSTARARTTRSTRGDFPFRQLANPRDRESAHRLRTRTTWCPRRACTMRSSARAGFPGLDPDGFSVGLGHRRANVRRVEPRNTPTMINAVFNHRNFWDMRAQNLFNGVNPFGDRDPDAFLYSAEDRLNPAAGAGAPRQLEPRVAGGRAAHEPVRDVGRRADVPRGRPAPHSASWDGATAASVSGC